MSDASFDTHAEIRKLEESGIPLPQAEALVDMVTRAPTNPQVMETLGYLKVQVDTNMATKADIAEIKGKLKEFNARFDAQDKHVHALFDAQNKHFHARFDAQNKEFDARFEAQRKDINAGFATLRADLFRALWLQGSVLAALILALAGVILAFATFTLSSPYRHGTRRTGTRSPLCPESEPQRWSRLRRRYSRIAGATVSRR